MSEHPLAVESEEEYEARAEELKRQAKDEYESISEKQQAALKEIAEGESLESYETVALGNLDIEVKAWFPGETMDAVEAAQTAANTEDMAQIRRSIDTMLAALDEMTRDSTYDMRFWRQYYQSYGPEGLMVAMQRVLGPATENMDEKGDAAAGFRGHAEGPRGRPGE